MILRFQRTLMILSLGAIVLTSSGCFLLIGAAAGAGGYAYVRGALQKNVDSTVKKIHSSSLKALKGLDIFVTDDELNVHSAKVNGEYADGKRVIVDIEALTERSSKIKVRVGTWGDKDRSLVIIGAIEKQL